MITLIAAGVVALLVVGGVIWAVNRDAEDPVRTETAAKPTEAPEVVTVLLEGAQNEGESPFTGSIVSVQPGEFPAAVTDVITTHTTSLVPDSVSGALLAPGDEPGLYGGTSQTAWCDVAALADALAADNGKAAIWAGALGIRTSGLADYVPSLTSLILLHDTAVTRFAFDNSKAVSSQYILQAGTAVLVDSHGQPVVRCASGNPLAQPDSIDLNTADLQGDEWLGFAVSRTVVVSPVDDELAGITAVDLVSGELYEQSVGAAVDVPGLLVAVGEQISTSPDGVTWDVVAGAPAASRIAYGDGLLVAAGSPADTSEASTLTYTSTDGVSWSAPETLPGRVADIAYADGVWVLLSTTKTGSGSANTGSPDLGIDGVLHTSPDGITWTAQDLSATSGEWDGPLAANSLSIAGGVWLLEALGYQGDSEAQVVQRSTDQGKTWQLVPFTNPVTGSSLAPLGLQWGWDGMTLAALGAQLEEVRLDGPSVYSAQGGVSADGVQWSFSPTSPPDTYFSSLTFDAGRGWIAAGRVGDFETGVHSVYGSSDLYSWTLLGTPDGAVSDVAVIPGDLPDGYQAPTASPTPTSVPIDPPADGPCLATTDSGNQLELRAVTGAIPDCSTMTEVWGAAQRGEGTFTGPRSIQLDMGWSCAYAPVTETEASGVAGACGPDDLSNPGFQLLAPGSAAPAPTAAGPSSNSAETVEGDLNLTIAMTQPACDGTGIVILGSAITPGAYETDVQNLLDAHPGSSYLRTDRACPSLNQATSAGNAIYAVFLVAGSDEATLRTAVCSAGADAYGKWLDSTTDPSFQLKC